MTNRVNNQDIKLIPRLGEMVNRVVRRSAQKSIKLPVHSYSIKQKKSHPNPMTQITDDIASLDVIVNNIGLIDKIHPTLHNGLKDHLFPDDVIVSQNKKKRVRSLTTNMGTQNYVDYSKYFEVYIRNNRIEKFSNLLNISRSSEKLKNIFLNGNGHIPYLYEQEEDIINNYDVTKKENINTMISISRQYFLHHILETYPDDDAIVKQFLLDLPRQDIYLNGHMIKTIDNLFMGLSMHNKLIYCDQLISKSRPHISTMMLALLMICQSSFCVSFCHLHNKVEKLKSVLNLNKHYKNDYRHNVHVADLKERNIIDINVTEETFSCSFRASYRIVDISEDTTLFKVQAETLFDLNSDLCLIIYEDVNHTQIRV